MLALPTFGQTLDWTRMVIDAHFARFVVSVNSAGGAAASEAATASGAAPLPPSPGALLQAQLIATLRDIAATVRAQATLGEAAGLLRGSLLHLLNAGALPAPPPTAHLIEALCL